MLKSFEKNWSSIAYIFCLLIVVCLIIVVWQGFRPQSIVIISNKGIDKVRIDSAQAVIKKKIYEKSYSASSDSALNLQIRSITDELENVYWNVGINDSLSWKTFLSKNDITTDKDSQLSLWAAALAVIFVLFSVYGLVKVDTTLASLKEEENKLKKLKNKIKTKEGNYKRTFDEIKKQLETYHETSEKTINTILRFLCYILSTDYEGRKKLLNILDENFSEIKDYAGILIEQLYRLSPLAEGDASQVDIKNEKIQRYNCIIEVSKNISNLSACRIINKDMVPLIHALSLFRKYQLDPKEGDVNEINKLFNEAKNIKEESDLGQEFKFCYNSFKADMAQNDDELIKVVNNIK